MLKKLQLTNRYACFSVSHNSCNATSLASNNGDDIATETCASPFYGKGKTRFVIWKRICRSAET